MLFLVKFHLYWCVASRLPAWSDPQMVKFVVPVTVGLARSSSSGVAMLCISGFVDDATFLHDGPMARCVYA